MLPPEQSSAVVPLLATLQSNSAPNEDKIDAYAALGRLIGGEAGRAGSQVLPKLQPLLTNVLAHIADSGPELTLAALSALGTLTHKPEIASYVLVDQGRLVLFSLCEVIVKTESQPICARALWCMSQQALSIEAIKPQMARVLAAIEHGQCKKNFKSMEIELEACSAIHRLLQQVPDAMETHALTWGKLVYPLLLHGNVRVQEQALVTMEMGMTAMMKHQDAIARGLLADLKTLLIRDMNQLMSHGQEKHVLRAWGLYIQLLGKLLHHGSLINQLLTIVEQGFKNQSAEIKCCSYTAWQALIDNFALNPDIVSDGKRVKLLMQVFKINNARVEEVALLKQSVWWHFVCRLTDKANTYFEQVVVPLLQFSLHGLVTPNPTNTPGSKLPTKIGAASPFSSPHLSLGPGGSQPLVFRSLQVKGVEILSLLLGSAASDLDNPTPPYSVELLTLDIITSPAFFAKHAVTFIGATRQAITVLGEDIPDELLHQVWVSLVAHIKNVLETLPKKDSVDVFRFFLENFKGIVENQSLSPPKLLKLFDAVLCLPSKVLSSSSYATVAELNVMKGSPAFYLLECLFHHRILETSVDSERFQFVLEKLTSCGFSHPSSALSFSERVLQLLNQSAAAIDSRQALWTMWSNTSHGLLNHILQSNEVNQGNQLEHDFTCLYEALMLPVTYLLTPLPQPTAKLMLKTWQDLYTTFARLAAMVPNVQANISCEELCTRILTAVSLEAMKSSVVAIDTILNMLGTVLAAIDYSSVSTELNFSDLTTHGFTEKFTKKQKRPLGNLHSIVAMVNRVSMAIHHHSSTDCSGVGGLPKRASCSAQLQTVATLALQHKSTLFTHIQSSAVNASLVAELSTTSALYLENCAQKSANKMYSPNVILKVEKLWSDICTCIESRYNGPFDADFLQSCSPLFAASFLHPRRMIKNLANTLWNSTFARAPMLTYPDNLKPVLARVQEKTPIRLPGWDAKEILHIEDTQISQMTQGDAPGPVIMGFPSPHKAQVGSFLNKAASPNVKRSPLHPSAAPQDPSTTTTPNAKRRLGGLDEMRDDDFVVISNSAKKKQVLTEHQKEVLKEHRSFPAMYNNLEVSQGASLMSQFCSDSQMSNATSTPTTPSDIGPYPFVLPSRPAIKNKENAKEDAAADAGETSADINPPRPSVRFADEADQEVPMDTSAASDDGLQNSMSLLQGKQAPVLDHIPEANSQSGDCVVMEDIPGPSVDTDRIVIVVQSQSERMESQRQQQESDPDVMETAAVLISMSQSPSRQAEMEAKTRSKTTVDNGLGPHSDINGDKLTALNVAPKEKLSSSPWHGLLGPLKDTEKAVSPGFNSTGTKETLKVLAEESQQYSPVKTGFRVPAAVAGTVLVVEDSQLSPAPKFSRKTLANETPEDKDKDKIAPDFSGVSQKLFGEGSGYAAEDLVVPSSQLDGEHDSQPAQQSNHGSRSGPRKSRGRQTASRGRPRGRHGSTRPSPDSAKGEMSMSQESTGFDSGALEGTVTPPQSMSLHAKLSRADNFTTPPKDGTLAPVGAHLSPVVQLQRLSQDEINNYSPQKGDAQSSAGSRPAAVKMAPLDGESKPSTQDNLFADSEVEPLFIEHVDDVINSVVDCKDSFAVEGIDLVFDTPTKRLNQSRALTPEVLRHFDETIDEVVSSQTGVDQGPRETGEFDFLGSQSSQDQARDSGSERGRSKGSGRGRKPKSATTRDGRPSSPQRENEHSLTPPTTPPKSSLSSPLRQVAVVVMKDNKPMTMLLDVSDDEDSQKESLPAPSFAGVSELKASVDAVMDIPVTETMVSRPKRKSAAAFDVMKMLAGDDSEDMTPVDAPPRRRRGRPRENIQESQETVMPSQDALLNPDIEPMDFDMPVSDDSQATLVQSGKRRGESARLTRKKSDVSSLQQEAAKEEENKGPEPVSMEVSEIIKIKKVEFKPALAQTFDDAGSECSSVSASQDGSQEPEDSQDDEEVEEGRATRSQRRPRGRRSVPDAGKDSVNSDLQSMKEDDGAQSPRTPQEGRSVSKLGKKNELDSAKKMTVKKLSSMFDEDSPKRASTTDSEDDKPLTVLVKKDKQEAVTQSDASDAEEVSKPSSEKRGRGRPRVRPIGGTPKTELPIKVADKTEISETPDEESKPQDDVVKREHSPRRRGRGKLGRKSRPPVVVRDLRSLAPLKLRARTRDAKPITMKQRARFVIRGRVGGRKSQMSPGRGRKRALATKDVNVEVKKEAIADAATPQTITSSPRTRGVGLLERSPVKSPTKTSPVKSPVKSPRKSLAMETEATDEAPPSPKVTRSPGRPRLTHSKTSPLRRSPPTRGRSFPLPDTPTSGSKNPAMSRASLILQRARMVNRGKSPGGAAGRGVARKVASPPKPLHNEDADASAHPSILKKSPRGSAASPQRLGVVGAPVTRGSPPTGGFRPIQIGHVYSPSASPSAGILRKRKFTQEVITDSPSPPSKQRRVCFNEEVSTLEIPSAQKKGKSRSIGRGSPRAVNRCLEMPPQPGQVMSPLVTGSSKVTTNQTKFITSKLDETEELQENSTQGDSLGGLTPSCSVGPSPEGTDAESPIYPGLAECETPVLQVLHQLTTSTWARGLEQLLLARNIRTVGALSTLTEHDVQQLPIRPPKLQTLTSVLERFHQTYTSTSSNTNKEPLSQLFKKSMEEADRLSPNKVADLDSSLESELLGASSDMLGTSADLLDDIHKLDDESRGPSDAEGESEDPLMPPPPPAAPLKPVFKEPVAPQHQLLKQVKELCRNLEPLTLARLPNNQLIQMHLEINRMSSSIVMALNAKSASST